MKIVSATVLLALAVPALAAKGGTQDFLDALRNFESGINPALADFYLQNLDNPVYTYAQVTAPGRLVRDCSTGSMLSEPTTISGFFNKRHPDRCGHVPEDAIQLLERLGFYRLSAG